VELLLNSGSREQDVRKALTISIRKGDSQVISLLLRRLALDLANNSICLGGFCIGRIEPAWLGPLFPDKTSNLRKQTSKYQQEYVIQLFLLVLLLLLLFYSAKN
jgi:leucine-rich repeat kinase 2